MSGRVTYPRCWLNTNLETVDNVAVIELLGESLDAVASEEVKSQLCGLAAEHPRLVVDMSRITFLDSSGCGTLVTAQKRCQEAGGELLLCNISDQVQTVLDITRMTRVLAIYPTREKAVAAFA